MPTQDKTIAPTYTKYNFLKAHAQDALPRDKTQSRRLHEPTLRNPLIDPITGEDINKMDNQPQYIDGNLTVYFTSDVNRKTYLDMPINHPSVHLPYPASDEDDRGG